MKNVIATWTYCMVISISAGTSSVADADDYPRATLLMEASELASRDSPSRVVILDARSREKYQNGHIPGAQWVDHDAWAKAFGHGKDNEQWSQRIGTLGVRPDSRVVVYDDSYLKDAARIWWILRYWGVEDVRLLNGAWVGWKAAGNRSEMTETKVTATTFAAKPRAERLATMQQLRESLESGSLQIVDARSEKEFCGIEQLNNKRAGAIPGAKHLEWIDLIDKETHRFKPATDLRSLFNDAGIDLTRPTAAHCQSGGRSSVMAFAMELMGAERVSNYYASWFEWSGAEDTPVVAGKPKQKD